MTKEDYNEAERIVREMHTIKTRRDLEARYGSHRFWQAISCSWQAYQDGKQS